MRNSIKTAAKHSLDTAKSIVKQLYDHPEIGNEEFFASKLLCDTLRDNGFTVTESYILPTAFLAEYDTGKPGRTVAFMCEYDALPEVGHGCGHNHIAATGVLAGIALKNSGEDLCGKILVIGTPAEENFGGKVTLSEQGAFDKVDAALMLHPGTENGLGGRVNAIEPRKFEFHGKSAHGCGATQGASALDAAVMTYTALSMHRQYMPQGYFLHGIIRNGGGAANVIPDYASMEYYFRAPSTAEALELANHGIACAEAAAKAARCTLEVSVYEMPYGDIRINYALANLLADKFAQLGVENVQPVEEQPAGSSDVGAVSYRCPTIQGSIKIADSCVAGHSVEMAAATLSDEGNKALLDGACALADMAADLLTDDELYATVKAEFDSDSK